MPAGLPAHGPFLVGVVHLVPLPGAPRAVLPPDACLERALEDGRAYRDAGFDGLLVENFGDAPFTRDRVEPHVPAFMALATRVLREATDLPVGVNVLRNDALSAMGAAAAGGGTFVRVNVLLGVTATDQGLVEGPAAELLRYRRSLGAGVAVWADVDVKHGTPLYRAPPEEVVRGLVGRGGASALIVTGPATGSPPAPEEVAGLRRAAPAGVPVVVGSGVDPGNVGALAAHAGGFIVGTACKVGGDVTAPVDPARAAAVEEALRAARRRP